MKASQLYFTGVSSVEVRDQELPHLGAGQVLVENSFSAISAGTEMLLYRGQLPEAMSLDENLEAFSGQQPHYPTQYGYACVGRIVEAAEDVDANCIGTTVFSFQPHASHHVCSMDSVIPVPKNIDPKQAVFLANMETAVNFVHDGNPRLGERVVVLGQGVVGLLTSSVLAKFPLADLYAVEGFAPRRALAIGAGVDAVFDPFAEDDMAALKQLLGVDGSGGADVVFELSGSPKALDLAIELCAYSGRIVVGSWYGTKREPINLGESFHRKRIEIVSSQVSTIAPALSGRWDKERRFDVAWDMIDKCQPAQIITHSFSIADADEAYRLLEESPTETAQIVFKYRARV